MRFIINKQLHSFMIIGIFWGAILSSCSKSRYGKIDLSQGTLPQFLKVGETRIFEVLEKIGEPLGYRENGNRAIMIYSTYHENYYFLLVSEIRLEKAFRLDLVFKNMILEKAEVKREGWGFGGNINTYLLQILSK